MARLLLIDDDGGNVTGYERTIRRAGHEALMASAGLPSLELLARQAVDLVLTPLRLRDTPRFEILHFLRERRPRLPVIVMAGSNRIQDALVAMRFGAIDVVDSSISDDELLRAIDRALACTRDDRMVRCACARTVDRAHAAARWVRVIMPILDAPRDPRTLSGWSRLAFISPGALKHWCHMAGLPPRHALVFARLLRAVLLARGGQPRPENLLDVVDRRTLAGLLRLAGLNPDQALPADIDTFLAHQVLVRDPAILSQVTQALATRRRPDHLRASGVAPP